MGFHKAVQTGPSKSKSGTYLCSQKIFLTTGLDIFPVPHVLLDRARYVADLFLNSGFEESPDGGEDARRDEFCEN